MYNSVLITGAGMVGAQIARLLFEQSGRPTVMIDRFFDTGYLNQILPAQAYVKAVGDLLDADFIRKTIKEYQVDAIIHTAAVLPMRVGHDAHPAFLEVNTWGSGQLMFLAKELGVKKFVLFSTNGVYRFKEFKPDGPVSEDFASGLSHHNAYGNSKALAEETLLELIEEGSFDGNIIRPGEIFGPVKGRDGDDDIYWLSMIKAAAAGEHFVLKGHPEHRLDWVYSKDVAALAARLLDFERTPRVSYHASSGACSGIYDLIDVLDELCEGHKVILEDCSRGGWNFPLSMENASVDLDFRPAFDLRSGVEDLILWLKRNTA